MFDLSTYLHAIISADDAGLVVEPPQYATICTKLEQHLCHAAPEITANLVISSLDNPARGTTHSPKRILIGVWCAKVIAPRSPLASYQILSRLLHTVPRDSIQEAVLCTHLAFLLSRHASSVDADVAAKISGSIVLARRSDSPIYWWALVRHKTDMALVVKDPYLDRDRPIGESRFINTMRTTKGAMHYQCPPIPSAISRLLSATAQIVLRHNTMLALILSNTKSQMVRRAAEACCRAV